MIRRKYFINTIIISVLVLIGVISYQQEMTHPINLKQTTEQKLEIKQKSLDSEVIPEKLLTLNTNPILNIEQGNIKANLFGKFFYNRAEFYIIENPQNKIYTSQTESITLFYLDGELSQTKYLLKNNIVSFLLKDLGDFIIKGRDLKNRDIISSGQYIIRDGKKLSLNNGLDNYQLKWAFEDKEVIYSVNTAANNANFEYLEKRKGYEEEFKAIERNSSYQP